MQFKHFVFKVLFATACSIALIASANWLVDPYQVWDSGEVTHWKFEKPSIEFHQRFSEIQRALIIKPEAVVIGTSRADIGLDPRHPVFSGMRTFNLATQGQPPAEARLILEKFPSLKRVLWATDFFTYGCQHQRTIHDFNQGLFSESARWLSLISITTVRDSILTVLSNPSPVTPWNRWRGDGFRQWADNEDYIRTFGFRRKSLASEKQYIESLYGDIKSLHCSPADGSNPLEEYRQALKIAHAKNVDLRLVIGPSHGRQWETLAASGLWDLWETWKRELVRINESEADKARREPFSLWDFSGYNSVTVEAFPDLADSKTQMKWYWDSSHYKKEAGDLVLNKVFNDEQRDHQRSTNFGIMLSSINIDSHLRKIREARSDYRRTHSKDVGEIETLATEFRAKSGLKNTQTNSHLR
jgi:hypothetical protein